MVYSDNPNEPNLVIVPLRTDGENTVSIVNGQQRPDIQGWISEAIRNDSYKMTSVATPVFRYSARGERTQYYVFIPLERNEIMLIRRIKKTSPRKYVIYMNNGEKISIKIEK